MPHLPSQPSRWHRHNSLHNLYVQSYTLNGTPVKDLRIPFGSVTAGGKLEAEMGNTPKDSY